MFANKQRMTYKFAVLIVYLLPLQLAAETVCSDSGLREVPKIGDVLSGLLESPGGLIVNSGTIAPCYFVIADGIEFEIAVSRTSFAVIFVSTQSARFSTPEGVSVMTAVEELISQYGDFIHEERGWGKWIELPSGWNIFLTIEDGAGQSEERFIFKRK